MKNKDLDIEKEYERLFGTPKRTDLFNLEEDYENGLRQMIIDAPKPKVTSRNNPFLGVKLLPFHLFSLEEEINKFKEKKELPLLIKRSSYGKPDFCYAIGYYDKLSKMFTVIKNSYISSQYNDPGGIDRRFLTFDGKHLYLKCQRYFTSVQIAASYVLGFPASGDEWKDLSNKSIKEIYPELASEIEPHYFYISKGNIRAFGYFEQQTGYFYIKKDSHVAASIQPGFSKNKFYSPRLRFLREACEYQEQYYKVTKDAKCRSAEAAAKYVLAEEVSYREWKDIDGKQLDEYLLNDLLKK